MFVRMLFVATLAVSGPVAAQELTEAGRDAFVEATGEYQQAYNGRDAAALVDVLPPLVAAHLTRSESEGRKTLVADVADRLDRETDATLKVHPDRADFVVTPDGLAVALAPMVHVSIRRDDEPFQVRRPVSGQMKLVKLVTEYETTVWSHLLGVHEDGKWWIVSLIDGDAVEGLLEVYPVFKERGLPRARSQMHARTVQVE